MKTRLQPSDARGFTILEMVLALSAFVLLMGGIFGIANSTMELSNDLAAMQERSLIRQNFVSFLRRSFRSLPGDAEVRLIVSASGGAYAPSLNFVNAGTSFTPGSPLPPDTSVDLYAEERPGGYLRVGLRILDEQQTQALRSGQTVRYNRNQGSIPLLDNVSRFEWRYYDPTTNRWENNWRHGRRPLMAELNLKLDDGFESRSVFWLPPVIPNALSTGGMVPGMVPGMPQVPNPDGSNPGIPDVPDVTPPPQ